MRSCLRQQNGFSAILMVLILSMISLVAFGVISDRTVGLAKAGQSYRINQLKRQLALEAEIIFTNPVACVNLLSVSDTSNNFSLGTLIYDGATYRGEVYIQSTKVLNPVIQSDGSTLAEFVVKGYLKANHDQKFQTSHEIYYHQTSTGGIDLCKLKMTQQQACVQMGVEWDANQNRCLICESMGGTWGGTCVF